MNYKQGLANNKAARRWSSLGAKQLKSALSLIYVSTENPERKKNTSLTPVGQARDKKVQVGKDQEKAQSERDSHSKNRGGKKPN